MFSKTKKKTRKSIRIHMFPSSQKQVFFFFFGKNTEKTLNLKNNNIFQKNIILMFSMFSKTILNNNLKKQTLIFLLVGNVEGIFKGFFGFWFCEYLF